MAIGSGLEGTLHSDRRLRRFAFLGLLIRLGLQTLRTLILPSPSSTLRGADGAPSA